MSLKKIKLSSEEEEVHIESIFNNAMDTLGEDRNLPQSETIQICIEISIQISIEISI